MTNEIEMQELLPCPFCGNDKIHITKKPLWTEYIINRDINKKRVRGYEGSYEITVVCDKCGAHPTYIKNDTIYHSEEEAISNVVNAWNKRVMNSAYGSKCCNTEDEKDEFQKRSEQEIIDKLVSITRSSEFLLTQFNDTDVHSRLHSIAADAYHI